MLDENYWSARYANSTTGWDLGHVSNPLRTIIDDLEEKNSAILIPGGGNGYEAVYLHERGFTNITVVDISQQPLINLKNRLKDTSGISLVHGNFFDLSGSYDLILEQTFFCALEVRFRESYVKKCQELLKENGGIEGVLFDFSEKRTEPPFGGSEAEYIQLFEPYFHILQMKRCLDSEPGRMGKELLIKMQKRS